MTQTAPQLIALSRSMLERIRDAMAQGDPFAAAPNADIATLHEVITFIVAPEDQPRYRLNGLHGVNRQYLRKHVEGVLREFDHLVANNPRL